MNALVCANYLCEIDEKHPTFKRKYIDVNYTEPHNLIKEAGIYITFNKLLEMYL